ncbi:ATP-binding cassette domain-containing protein [Litorisediminicola beolgyonensis]|uniref:ATP-binding cassette domain-containing protein n=1 Tax=Litorisediminicola beolgyonensis TaxID=1173614 RepID=A0ABW3ZFM3_9RHOB
MIALAQTAGRSILGAILGKGGADDGGQIALADADACAEAIRRLARRRGLEPVLSDIRDAVGRERSAADAALAGARAAGLIATKHRAAPGDVELPALAVLKSGEITLVLGVEGDEIIAVDPQTAGEPTSIEREVFLEYFSGLWVQGEPPIANIAEKLTSSARDAHWFWGLFARFRKPLSEVAIGSFVANILAVSTALFALQVYDRVIPHQSEATLWVLAAGAMAALIFEGALKLARGRLLDGTGRQLEAAAQRHLMARLAGMRSDIAAKSPARLFAAMRDFGSVREFFTASTVGALADLPFLAIFLVLIAVIAGPVVWLVLAGAALMILPGLLMQRRMVRMTEDMQGASVRQSRLLQEVVGDLDTLKTQRGEARMERLWAELTAVQALKSSDQRRLAAALTVWAQGVQQATYIGAVIAGTYLVFSGSFTVGAIIATGILTSRTLAPLTQLTGILARWSNVKTALDALDEIADAPQDRDAARTYLRRPNLDGRFELRGVTFRYREGAPALDLTALAIPAGQRVAVLGANGSGKSTFLKVLSGLYPQESGRLLLDGVEMAQIDPRDLRRGIGYLGQDVRLFSGSLRENLTLANPDTDDARLYEALDFAGLGQFVKAHPEGLDLVIGDGGAGLSVGQRQSVGWARLWLQDPAVCLLDEPTAALDQTLEKTLVSRLETWLDGRTAIIATHRVPILSLVERTVILSGGKLAVDGPKREVLDHLARAANGEG